MEQMNGNNVRRTNLKFCYKYRKYFIYKFFLIKLFFRFAAFSVCYHYYAIYTVKFGRKIKRKYLDRVGWQKIQFRLPKKKEGHTDPKRS